tara:strand:- start:522 stop:776 length:255 start_codon:yes stop_codon:yes gene_type:complete
MNSDINLSASDMRKLAEITVLLNVNIELKLWVEGVCQANWKKEATSYMWRSNTDSVEIVHNKDYDNVTVCYPEELINSLKFVGA